MNKFLITIVFLIASFFTNSVLAFGESIQTSGPKPGWASQLTVEDNADQVSFVGLKSDAPSIEEGITAARESAIHQFLQYLSFDVSSRYRRTRHNENQYSYEVILGKTYPVSVSNLKESAVYWEKSQDGKYQIYLLLPVNRSEISRIELHWQRSIRVVMATLKETDDLVKNGKPYAALQGYLTALEKLEEFPGKVKENFAAQIESAQEMVKKLRTVYIEVSGDIDNRFKNEFLKKLEQSDEYTIVDSPTQATFIVKANLTLSAAAANEEGILRAAGQLSAQLTARENKNVLDSINSKAFGFGPDEITAHKDAIERLAEKTALKFTSLLL
jgi:hypothetical protein